MCEDADSVDWSAVQVVIAVLSVVLPDDWDDDSLLTFFDD